MSISGCPYLSEMEFEKVSRDDIFFKFICDFGGEVYVMVYPGDFMVLSQWNCESCVIFA